MKLDWLPFYIETHNRWLLVLTLLVGLLLDSIAWPRPWGVSVPDITPLILLYWVLALEKNNFIVTTFVLGILHDALYHTGLGTYALIYLVLIYPMLHLRLQIRNKTLFQMSLIVGVWLAVHQALVWLLTPAIHMKEQLVYFTYAIIVGMMLWPSLFLLLRALRRSAKIR